MNEFEAWVNDRKKHYMTQSGKALQKWQFLSYISHSAKAWAYQSVLEKLRTQPLCPNAPTS